jgi:hypothetical protein
MTDTVTKFLIAVITDFLNGEIGWPNAPNIPTPLT